MKKNTAQQKKRISTLAAFLITTLLALLLSTAGVTLAKYFSRLASAGAAVPRPFYFSSDLLKEDFPYYRLEEPAAGEEITIEFTLSNFIDQLRRTNGEMHYAYWAVSGTDPKGEAIAGTRRESFFSGIDFETTIPLKISLSREDFGADGVVTVVAESTSPYDKIIGAQFGFATGKQELQYNVIEEGDAVVLQLSGGSGQPVTVSWTEGMHLAPDKTNTILQGVSGTSVTFTAESGVRYALTFFREIPGAPFNKNDFTVTEGGVS